MTEMLPDMTDRAVVTEERRKVRAALIDQGFLRTGATRDFGDGVYTETFYRAGIGEIQIEWEAKP